MASNPIALVCQMRKRYMKTFEDLTFDEKMLFLENSRLNALQCIREGYPANLADIADWFDDYGPWLINECKRLNAMRIK